MKLNLALVIYIVLGFPIWAQVSQSRPEYCGLPEGVNPSLPDFSATIDPIDGHAVLYFGRGDAAKALSLPGYWISEIAEVCPLADGRLVVFADFGGVSMSIVDRTKPALLDYFIGYRPSMSPDQRWIVFEKFYPLHGVDGSSEYLIYDLTKSPARNRPDGDARNSDDVGAVVFPPGQKNVLGDNIGVPESQLHHGGIHHYWAPDSRALLFEDQIVRGPKKLILISLNENGTPTALEHEATRREICGGEESEPVDFSWHISDVQAGPERGGGRSIALTFHVDDGSCPAHSIQLSKADFQPVRVETHEPPRPGRLTVKK